MNTIPCPRCRTAIPADPSSGGADALCPQCRVPLRIAVLPAATVSRPPASTGAPAVAGEAVCFFHSTRSAVVPCDRCGRFLCALCDLPLGDTHLCPSCLESGMRGGSGTELETRRLRPDLIAAYLLLLGMLSCGLLFPVTGLAAVVVAWRYRSAPPSLVDPSARRLRLLVAAGMVCFILGLAEWAWVFTQAVPWMKQLDWMPIP